MGTLGVVKLRRNLPLAARASVVATLLAVSLTVSGCAKDRAFSDSTAQTTERNLPAASDAGMDAGTGPCRLGTPCDVPLVCAPETGFCVECIGDAECSGNMPVGDAGAATVCDVQRNECVRCTSDANCSGDTPVCSTRSADHVLHGRVQAG